MLDSEHSIFFERSSEMFCERLSEKVGLLCSLSLASCDCGAVENGDIVREFGERLVTELSSVFACAIFPFNQDRSRAREPVGARPSARL